MKVYFHADDIGLSQGITDNIVDCLDSGSLNSTSLLCNGHSFEYAVKKLKQRPHVRVVLHCNLTEGKSLTNGPLLTNQQGHFNRGFIGLWWLSHFKRQELGLQIETELEAQIKKFKQAFDLPLIIDSHVHYHMIPLVFDVLIRLHQKYSIQHIRLPLEPFHLALDRNSFKSLFKLGPLKHLLLSYLARKAFEKLKQTSIHTCEAFIGITYTGHMQLCNLKRALEKIQKVKSLEILFHPGQAVEGEEGHWQGRPDLFNYYFSVDRMREKEFLQGEDWKEFQKQISSFS